MNIKTAGDCFIRTVIAQVEVIRVDLAEQKWSVSNFRADSATRYRFNLWHRPTADALKIARCTFEVGVHGVKIEFPWHFSPYDYRAEHINGGLQLEGDVEQHDELLRRVAGALFRANQIPQEIRELFHSPSLRVYGFKVGSEVRRMSDLDPIDIPHTDRAATRCFLDALESGCGKGGAEAHLHYAHGFFMTKARRFGTELVRSYPSLFHRLDAGRYRLTLWGRHVLEELTGKHRGGDLSW